MLIHEIKSASELEQMNGSSKPGEELLFHMVDLLT